MAEWCEFCAVCGGPPLLYNYEDLIQDKKVDKAALQKLLTDTRWLEEWIGIPPSENYYSIGSYDKRSGFFENYFTYSGVKTSVGKFSLQAKYMSNPKKAEKEGLYGVGCHIACFKVLENELGYRLSFSDIYPRLIDRSNLIEEIDYLDIAKYQEQSFDIVRILKDGTDWMLLNPLENIKSRERIVAMWAELVKKLLPPPRKTRKARATPKPAVIKKKSITLEAALNEKTNKTMKKANPKSKA
jgi:hypothetical protein